MAEDNDTAARRAHFLSLLARFGAGMLITHGRDGSLHARPMVLARADATGDVWLLSDIHAEKVDELAADARVSVTLQDGPRFVALSGKGEVVRDARLARSLWRDAWSAWFPHGPEHPDTVLLAIRTVRGEYWDHSGREPVRHLLEAARALVAGEAHPAPPGGAHAELGL